MLVVTPTPTLQKQIPLPQGRGINKKSLGYTLGYLLGVYTPGYCYNNILK
jgi:hypothetical protein